MTDESTTAPDPAELCATVLRVRGDVVPEADTASTEPERDYGSIVPVDGCVPHLAEQHLAASGP